MFIIVYARIVDNKKKGLDIEGPFLGQEAPTMAEAHKFCEELVSNSKAHTLVRIFSLSECSEAEAKVKAQSSFEVIYNNMVMASEMLDRPTIKFKRKRSRTLEPINFDDLD